MSRRRIVVETTATAGDVERALSAAGLTYEVVPEAITHVVRGTALDAIGALHKAIEDGARQPYEPARTCPKCGNRHAATRYDAAADLMERRCACGFLWTELPLDRTSR